jgi:hypothetical protein
MLNFQGLKENVDFIVRIGKVKLHQLRPNELSRRERKI